MALSPLDDRYFSKVAALDTYFSEASLNKYRVLVEVEYLKALHHSPEITCELSGEEIQKLDALFPNFNETEQEKVKVKEQVTNHDVKAIEYYVKDHIAEEKKEWVHFGLTSEDVNNLSYTLMLRDGVKKVLFPKLKELITTLEKHAEDYAAVPLLSKTHGQPATPTTMGKEFMVFVTRLQRQMILLQRQDFLGKLGGASGNMNAHVFAYPEVDWRSFSRTFVEGLGLTWNPVTTQIEPHDFIAELADTSARINTICIDMARDIWGYISFRFFGQKTVAGEIGSSAMPHKVNPIDFENAEGNMGLSSAFFRHFSEKLPLSRFQRDLTDSTVLRNLGVAFGHQYLAFQSLLKGLSKLEIREEVLREDLNQNWEILAEAVQTVLRKHGVPNPYETLKEMTRGKTLTQEDYQIFIETLILPEGEKERLRKLTPATYLGVAREIVLE